MDNINKPLLKEKVQKEWVDYNAHMNDAAYALVFSRAVDRLMEDIGLNETFREDEKYSIYTLETHLCYLAEVREREPIDVFVQWLDYDSKRLHVFFEMKDQKGKRLATSEQMLMGMNMESRRPAPFPLPIKDQIQKIANECQTIKPQEAGRRIAIKRGNGIGNG
ncbi:thioesterase family protein [Fictibacillus sp. KU28468]|uniref:thioesterase family protein n=1 Tax=Fictibacillus sp. KU28468 TaxID=2991053 RepID=UPI00223C99F7|nr:thioesterase family protein [Fictibacillus sp. KU28468]UZJ80014.1 thioesterase family protein [Fictibacillus sp. KU28468]